MILWRPLNDAQYLNDKSALIIRWFMIYNFTYLEISKTVLLKNFGFSVPSSTSYHTWNEVVGLVWFIGNKKCTLASFKALYFDG